MPKGPIRVFCDLSKDRFSELSDSRKAMRKAIAGVWTCAGAAASAKIFRDHSKYQEQNPCVQLALTQIEQQKESLLFKGPLKIGFWPRRGHVDSNAGLMRAHFKVCGSNGAAYVLVGAKKERSEMEEAEDLEEVEAQSWKYYWLRPWEFKKAFLEKIRSFRRGSGEYEDPSLWRLETLVVLPDGKEPETVLGNPLALPEYESLCLKRDGTSKEEHSRRRLRITLGIALLATVFAGGARLLRSRHVWQSHGFVRKAVLGDRSIQTVLGPSHIESCNGTFTPTYINAQLKLVGNAGVADVTVAASRDTTGQSWRIAVARMNVGGVMCNLDIAQLHQ